MAPDELQAWLRLVLTPQVGPVATRRLLAAFGLPQQIFKAAPESLRTVATPAQVQALQTPPPGLGQLLESTLEWLAGDSLRRRVLTLADPDYPATLLETCDPPLMLHVIGECAARGRLRWPEGIAIVGSRNPTAQGERNARQFAASLARAGWTVVSGLALGVDAAAHEGALEGVLEVALIGARTGEVSAPDALATIAVVGTGLDSVYPRQHEALAHRIAERGLILSEYPVGTPPLSENFPRRNRILSALARGTLVVEAAVRSGSLITARFAAEQGREVFAIPGSIHSPQSRGCHALIRQGAKLVETAQDVLEELRHAGPAPACGNPARASDASLGAGQEGARTGDRTQEAQQARQAKAAPDAPDPLLQALGFDPVTLDALSARTGLPTPALQAQLLELELQGQVARLPGGLFQRVCLA